MQISHIFWQYHGLHVSYIIIGISTVFNWLIGKNAAKKCTIIFLMFYMFITGFSPSIVRAGIMSIIILGSKLVHRKIDIVTSISLSALTILIYNPFLITNIGFQFSYLGTIGIIVLHKNVLSILRNIKIKNLKWKYKFNKKIIMLLDKVKEILSVTISAQLAIFPVMIYHFNTFGIYFLITNLLVSIIIGPIIIAGVGATIISVISKSLVKTTIVPILDFLISNLIIISNISKFPFAKIYLSTPKIYNIIVYINLILIANYSYRLYHSSQLNNSEKRIRNLIALAKYKIRQNKNKCIAIFLIFIILVAGVKFIPRSLRIHFVDVGQGDSTFIITPNNQTILIDGGEDTLISYILDRGYTKINYIIISHFDSDHVRAEFLK